MKNSKNLKSLTELGLSENEAKTYLAALSLGPTTALKLSRATDIKRSTVYLTIESLKKKGLMRIELPGLKQLFVAEHPHRLEAALASREQLLKRVMPDLEALYNLKGEESTVKYYEGIEAVKGMYNDLLEEMGLRDEYLAISQSEPWFAVAPEFFQNFVEKRAEMKIFTRLLLVDSEKSRYLKKYERNFNMNVKLLTKDSSFTSNVTIVRNKLITQQMIPPVSAVVVENSSMADTQRQVFELLWNTIPNKN